MRWLFAIAVLVGASYSLTAWGLVEVDGGRALWETGGVALLALWAAVRAHTADGWLLTAALAFGALGDLLLETHGFVAGGAAFAIGHVVAIALYRRNLRVALTRSQALAGWMIAPLVMLIAILLAHGDAGVAIYAALLGTMAAFAWTSRFSRYCVGVGAMLFVASDLLIFARMGPLAGSAVPTWFIWPLYFAGQALIAWGAAERLGDRRVGDDRIVQGAVR